MKILFLNGPPRSGKDTAASYLHDKYGAYTTKFAKALKEATHALYGLGALPDDHFEVSKSKPNKVFFGLTPRQAYIKVSEELVKPVLGKDFFGQVMLETCKRAEGEGHDLIAISDSGFADEAQPLIDYFGPEQVYLVHIYAESRGCTFENDSRSYIKLPGLPLDNVWVLNNNSFIVDYHKQIDHMMKHVLLHP